MLAFTLDPGRWWIARPLGRNPLLRAADRLEALLVLVVIVGWLLVVPITGAVGTAIYDGRHRVYAEEALTRHRVVATVVEGTAPLSRTHSRSGRLDCGGRRGHRLVLIRQGGEIRCVWVDGDGNCVAPPTPTTQAVPDALCGALSILLSAMVVTALVLILMRSRLDRMRDTEWERELRAINDLGGPRRGNQ